jgi:hypothetical protein
MNAMLTLIDLVTKFGNEFVLSVNSALDQFQTLKISPDDPRSSNFTKSQVSFVLDAINALKKELEGVKSSFKFYDEAVRGQTSIVVEKFNLAFGSFQTQLTENLFKRFGDFEIFLRDKIIGKENEIQQCVVTIKEQEDLIQEAMKQLSLIDQNWVLQHAMLKEDIMHGLSAQRTYIFDWLTKAFEKQVTFLDGIKKLTAENIKENKFPEILSRIPIIVETKTNTSLILQMLPESFDGIKQFITDNLGIIHGKIFDISRLIVEAKELNNT